MELPTYTNIWKIEKRLYKLYDFRLPMPLPVGQVAAFLAIAVPYTLLLTVIGMPFSHTWVWLYVLPPALLAWLVTRPVLEGKRLPELLLSQLRYISEPRTWCRMAPLTERDALIVVAKVWRAPGQVLAAAAGASMSDGGVAARQLAAMPRARATVASVPAAPEVAMPPTATPATVTPALATPDAATPDAPNPAAAVPDAATPATVTPASATPSPPGETAGAAAELATCQPPERVRARAGATSASAARPVRPVVTIRSDETAGRPLHVVERALRAPANPAGLRREPVVVVPGGHRPGKADLVQRDQARARLKLPGPARIVVLGCTAGAGQTLTTLLTGQVLASLRDEAVAVLDLRPGPGSLTERAKAIPRLVPGLRPAPDTGDPDFQRERGLQVVTAESRDGQTADAGKVIDAVVGRYALTLADPAAVHVPRALQVAEQLVLVAPASSAAMQALAMTLEWLEAHDHRRLAGNGLIVLNGVNAQTAAYIEGAASVAAGRSRAIVRVPWDDKLAGGGPIGTPTIRAYTALAGLVVSGLADPAVAGTGSR